MYGRAGRREYEPVKEVKARTFADEYAVVGRKPPT